MFTRNIQQGLQQYNSIAQAPALTKNTFPFCIVKGKSALTIYPILAIIITTVFFDSCMPVRTTGSIPHHHTNISKTHTGSPLLVVYPSSTSTTLSGGAPHVTGAASFRWRQVGGTTTAAIAQPSQVTTAVSNLKPGIYTFTLTTTDNRGMVHTDTTRISVLQKMTWTVEGTTREALVHPPANGYGAAPVIFAFHGHGGTDFGFAEKAFELHWPEAMVIYPQGLRTRSAADPQGKEPGWQHSAGEVNSFTGVKDQDLKFFDDMLATLKQTYSVNTNQVFVHGWSNGGEFVYNVLWTARGNELTAIAPAAAILEAINGKRTIPVMHVAGTQDDKVPFNTQEQSVQEVRALNKCLSTGSTWAIGSSGLIGTQFPSAINDPEVFVQYNGSHSYPYTVPPLIVKFCKEVADHSKSLASK